MRFVLLPFVFTCFGCGAGGSATDLTANELFPLDWKNKSVTLRIANLEVPAEITMTEGGTRRKLTISRDNEVVEEEVYDVTSDSVSLVQLGTKESFSPPIPLLDFPLKIGQELAWRGQMLLAGTEVSASATSVSERMLADMPSGSFETILVTVNLNLKESGQEANRKLRVWFAKGEGPVKRDFGNQIREPRVSQ